MKVPFRWRMKWFLQGMASLFRWTPSKEQTAAEIWQCVDEMIERENSSQNSSQNTERSGGTSAAANRSA